MSKEQMLGNLKCVMTGEELSRIELCETEDGNACVSLDLHNLSCKKAERLTRNVINVNRRPFVLNAIHGFNHGTAIKEMILSTDFGNRVVERKSPAWNPGQTYLTIAA